MREQLARILLAILGATSAIMGVWAGFGPRSFYDDFPGFDHHWVSADGPFNEHLVRDFGWFNLALAVVALIAVVSLARAAVAAAAAAFLVSGVPHLVYHLEHLDLYSTGDQIGNVVALVLGPLAALVVLVLTFGGRGRATGAKMRASIPTSLSSPSST